MPRENRKRGKKHKKYLGEEHAAVEEREVKEPESEPSWIVKPPEVDNANSEAPFGYVNPDVKAYFKTVDEKLREWAENPVTAELDDVEDDDSNEDRRTFLMAALTEMSGKEKELATDPECSTILERMIYSMDDFVKRVLMDRFAGFHEVLIKNRFASHVVQTLIGASRNTVSREQRNIYPNIPDDTAEDGQLLTLTELILNLCVDLLPLTSTLIMDPFASHVLRALLILLCPSLSDEPLSTAGHHPSSSAVRSKRSTAFKAKRGHMRSILQDSNDPIGVSAHQAIPEDFKLMSKNFVNRIRGDLDANEVRALAADKIACPVLTLLLQVEAYHGMAEEPGSLLDRVSVGLIASCVETPSVLPPPSDYLATLLREPVSSHLLETMISLSPLAAYEILWKQYFEGTLSRLAAHPVANFVVAKAVERLSTGKLLGALDEMKGSWPKHIQTARTSVLRAMIDRAAYLQAAEEEVCEAVYIAFGFTNVPDRKMLVPSILKLKSCQEYQHSISAQSIESKNIDRSSNPRKTSTSAAGFTIQGSLLLQSILRLHEPFHQPIIDSVQSLSLAELLEMARDPTGSRALDVFLQSTTVAPRAKRKLILSFLNHYHLLVDDRIGSRVGDQCWAAADTYLREKIAQSLIPHEVTLAGSFYGKFFVKTLRLNLLKRRPDEWKAIQSKLSKGDGMTACLHDPKSEKKGTKQEGPTHPLQDKPPYAKGKKRKHEGIEEDEIDVLFLAAFGKKNRKGHLKSSTEAERDALTPDHLHDAQVSGDLNGVLSAIRAAPRDTPLRKPGLGVLR